MNKKFVAKHLAIVFAASCVIIILVYYQLFFLRQQTALNSAYADYLLEKMRLEEVKSFAAAHPAIDDYLNELDIQLESVNKILPEISDISGFIVDIYQSAAQTGVKILQIKPSPAVFKQDCNETEVELMTKGDYFSQLAFLKSVEANMRFTVVRAVTMQAGEGFLETKYNILIYNGGQSN